ncbi:hypothetical protein LMG28690_00737 [Paraburkholderia caffeinilytica]|nr:hypothetical protein LMG28690_00737 [Paraburkholderia caffeinilytica]
MPGGGIGSIGVFSTHQRGPLQDGTQSRCAAFAHRATAHLQARVNDDYDRFAGAVSRNRGVDVVRVRNGMGQGRILGA